MCGRYTLINPSTLTERFKTINTLSGLTDNFNVAPGQTMPAIVAQGDQNVLRLMKWGLVPSWAKEVKIGYKMINARSEGIETKPSFRHAYKKQRCLIPASGFYEWQKIDGQKIPQYIRVKNQEVFSFAGLWEHWQQPNAEPLETYTIITTQANQFMQTIHDRMPVILPQKLEDDWLNPSNQDPDFLRNIIQSSTVNLTAYPVSTEVNKPQNNTAGLINPL